MQAAVGDMLRIHGHNVGDPDKTGEILKIHGKSGEPPYTVRFADGHTSLMFPGPDAVVEPPARKASRGKASGTGRTAKAAKGGKSAKARPKAK
jgi:hypothetical protein